jgi:hypothetical protein
MRNLLADKRVQWGLGAAVIAVAVWLLVAGGDGDKVEEANTAPEAAAAEVVAPATVPDAAAIGTTGVNNPTTTATNANVEVTTETTNTETTTNTDNSQ